MIQPRSIAHRGRPQWWQTAAQLEALAQIDLGSTGGAYPMQEASGNLIDVSGNSRDVPKTGSPTYGALSNSHRGLACATSSDNFQKSAMTWPAPGVSFVLGGRWAFSGSSTTSRPIFVGTGASNVSLIKASTTHATFKVADTAGPFSLTIDLGVPVADAQHYAVFGQIDFAAGVARAILARSGVYTLAEGSIATWVPFGTSGIFEQVGANGPSGHLGDLFHYSGSHAEGASALVDLVGRLGHL